VLRFKDSAESAARNLACAWQTSLARLSCELEGHALGGGVLKLEPTEAENTLLPRFTMNGGTSTALSSELDALLRSGNEEAARAASDKAILREKLNLTKAECKLLAEAIESLQARRL
jgi:hypothetical protein